MTNKQNARICAYVFERWGGFRERELGRMNFTKKKPFFIIPLTCLTSCLSRTELEHVSRTSG